MTPEKREELTKQLAEHGLSVLLTRDFDAILLQLARLAQFERLMVINEHLFNAVGIAAIRASCGVDSDNDLRPMEVIDIPLIGIEVNRATQIMLDKQAHIDLHRLPAAVLAFVGILSAEVR